MPVAYILVGVSGSGKSTWAYQQPWDMSRTVIAGTDKHIEKYAVDQGKTFDEVFREGVLFATEYMDEEIKQAVAEDKDIVWDMSSVTKNCRALRISQLPYYYKKIAVYFTPPPLDELKRRIESRPGKTRITFRSAAEDIERFLTYPTLDEGFAEIREPW